MAATEKGAESQYTGQLRVYVQDVRIPGVWEAEGRKPEKVGCAAVLQRPCGFTASESGNGGEHPYRAASGAGFCSGGEYLRINPSDNALKELKQTHNLDSERRKALTAGQQKLLMNFLKNSEKYNHWLPIITVMVECGLRAGEATGLRWEDINLDTGEISVNHTLIYYSHREKGCLYGINTPKTEAGNRIVPMTPEVKAAFVQEREYQKKTGISCKVTIDGYTDFIFVNRFGECQHHSTINKGIDRIIRDCNEEQLAKCESGTIKPKNLVLLPKFSCHSLRHTCATRLCEAGINMKVIQDVLGHADITTTMNIYTEATKNLKKKEIDKFAEFLSATTTFEGKEEND